MQTIFQQIRSAHRVHFVLLLGIGLISWQLAALEPQVHEPGISEAEADALARSLEEVGAQSESSAQVAPSRERFDDFDKQPVFDTLVEIPRIEEPPLPPKPPADLLKVIAQWEFHFPDAGIGYFTDTRTGTDFQLSLQEEREVLYDGEQHTIRLFSLDEQSFSATVGYLDQRAVFSPYGVNRIR